MQTVFQYKTGLFTHMPHVMPFRGRELLLLSCKEPTGTWRPAYTDWNDELDPIHEMPIGVDGTVCNLFGEIGGDGLVRISFIRAGDDNVWRLYGTSTADFVEFTEPVVLRDEPCWTGFSRDGLTVTANANVITVERDGTSKSYLFERFESIFRVTFADGSVMVTAMVDELLLTYRFDIDSLRMFRIVVAGETEVYKGTVYGEYVVCAQKTAPGAFIDQRKLMYASKYTLEYAPDVVASEPQYATAAPPVAGGPGTELKKMLALVGITASEGCACNERAATMDNWGCDETERRIPEVAGWLREEAERRGVIYVDAAARVLIVMAIRNARKEARRATQADQKES